MEEMKATPASARPRLQVEENRDLPQCLAWISRKARQGFRTACRSTNSPAVLHRIRGIVGSRESHLKEPVPGQSQLDRRNKAGALLEFGPFRPPVDNFQSARSMSCPPR